jgi:hypothetical protein
VVVDRHPYGTAGELRAGLDLARRRGSALVLGLRDVLDDASVIREEMRGLGWTDVEDVYDEVLVYGGRNFVDHEAEYGLTLPLHYCGWVAERAEPRHTDRRLLVVAAGGGGDGAAVFELGAQLLVQRPDLVGLFAPGPTPAPTRCAGSASWVRSRTHRRPPGRVRTLVLARRRDPVHGGLQLHPRSAGRGATSDPDAPAQPAPRAGHPGRWLAGLALADVVEPGTDPPCVAALLQRIRAPGPDGALDGGRDRPRRGAQRALRLHALSAARSVR